MKNKVFVEVVVPHLDQSYEVFIPINRKVGNVIELLVKSIGDLSYNSLQEDEHIFLYNAFTFQKYEPNTLIKDTDIRNGSRIVLM